MEIAPNNLFIEARERFERDGFCLTPPVLPPELVQRAVRRMDAVIAGEYETGVAPVWRTWKPGDDPGKIRKIDQPHLADRTILELIRYPEIGRWAAAITGAKCIQVWAVQMLYKPPGGDPAGNVGWHQDKQYWSYWEGEVFTAWLALSHVSADAGPVRFLRGSHRWGFLNQGNFFESNLKGLQEAIRLPEGASWEEAAAILPCGALSFHHRLTYHGSGPNQSAGPRRSFALHMRTEKSKVVPGAKDVYVQHLDEPEISPVIYQETEAGLQNYSHAFKHISSIKQIICCPL